MDETKKDPESDKSPAWEYREGFRINSGMKEVVQLSVDLAKTEIARYREKLRKITYGA